MEFAVFLLVSRETMLCMLRLSSPVPMVFMNKHNMIVHLQLHCETHTNIFNIKRITLNYTPDICKRNIYKLLNLKEERT